MKWGMTLIVAGVNKTAYQIPRFTEPNIVVIDKFIESSELSCIFRNADAVILPYSTISESGVLHLSFSNSLPVLTSNLEGFRKRVVDGFNGILFELTKASIQESIIRFIENREAFKKNLLEYHDIYLEQFSWEKIAERTHQAYTDLL